MFVTFEPSLQNTSSFLQPNVMVASSAALVAAKLPVVLKLSEFYLLHYHNPNPAALPQREAISPELQQTETTWGLQIMNKRREMLKGKSGRNVVTKIRTAASQQAF